MPSTKLRMLGHEPATASRLLRRVVTTNRRLETRVAHDLDVNQTDYRVMGMLMSLGPLTQKQVGERLGLSQALVSLSIDRLEALGHVTRSRNPTDGRSVVVAPTPSSCDRAMRHLLPLLQSSDAAIADMSGVERAAVETYLTRVLAAMDEALDAFGER